MKQELIVVAEDSPTQAEKLRYLLEDQGYDVAHGRNGREALKLIHRERPGLIVTDVNMPEMGGYELCRSIKNNIDLQDIPVLLLTSLTDAEDILKGLECGADSYVMKPFDAKQLIPRIQSILKEKPVHREKIVQENADVLFEGKRYMVNSTRFQILNMLLSTYEGAVEKTQKLTETQNSLRELRMSLESKVEERTKDLLQEIKERQSIESAIKESEKKYRNLVENALVGVFSSTLDGRLHFINEALSSLLEYSSNKKLMSETFQSLCYAKDDYKKLIEELKNNHKVQNFEIKLVAASGKIKWVILNALLKGEHISGMLLDITARKLSDEKEKKYQKELISAKDKAEESDQLKSAFISNMSHEVRTPLNAIIGFSSLLSETGISAANRKEFIHLISKSCHSLSNLIKNILDVAKLEAGKIKVNERTCTINQLLEEIYSIYSSNRDIIDRGNVSFIMHKVTQDEKLTILTDPDRIKQIISKLLDNAFKFTEKGSVEFGYEVQKDKLQFFVTDTGMGLTEDQKEYIFVRFRKAEDVKTKIIGGAGLGLAISKKLVNLLGGKIWVGTEPGNGSTFFFTIPLKVADEPANITPQRIVGKPERSLQNINILVAEDNPNNFKLIEAILSGKGVNLTWAKNGSEAVDYFRSGKEFDIVLMDLQMPEMDGFQATKEIKQIIKEIPIIAVTALDLHDVEEKAMQTGFNEFLIKPFNADKLIATIKKYVYENASA